MDVHHRRSVWRLVWVSCLALLAGVMVLLTFHSSGIIYVPSVSRPLSVLLHTANDHKPVILLPPSCRLAAPQTSGSARTATIIVTGAARAYRVYLPEGYSNTVLHALILNFHGYHNDAQQQEAASGFDALANSQQFIMVYPDGTIGSAGGRGWNTGLHPGITSNDQLFVRQLISRLETRLCINQREIYATGFSNGAGFVDTLACDMSAEIAAFAPVSGSYVTPPADCRPSRAVPIIEFHGTSDSIVPYAGNPAKREPPVQSWLAAWAHRDDCAPEPHVLLSTPKLAVYGWSGCAASDMLMHYQILGGTHRWPAENMQDMIAGGPRTGSAAMIIWHFFERHPLPVATRV